jgi:ketosteroid isomerase-like protein
MAMVRTMRKLFLAALVWPALVAADPALEVRCAEIRFSLAVEGGDRAAFLAAIDVDARFVGSEVARGPAAVAEAWAVFFEPEGPRIAWRPRIVEVLNSGDYALSRGPYRLEARGADGKPVVRWGTFNSVWRKQPDGRWQVVFDAGGPPTEAEPEGAESLFGAAPVECTGA